MENNQAVKEDGKELRMDLIPQKDPHSGCELSVPVTLRFSAPVTHISGIRRRILDALITWVEDGPGFVEEDDSFTTGIYVGEPQIAPEPLSGEQTKNKDDYVFTTIRWSDEDLMQALEEAGADPTPENIQRFKESRGPHTLEDRSIEEGWTILSDIIGDMLCNGTLTGNEANESREEEGNA